MSFTCPEYVPKQLDNILVLSHHDSANIITLTSHERHNISNHRWFDRLLNSFCLLAKINQRSTLPALCDGHPPGINGFPKKWPVMRTMPPYYDDIMWDEAHLQLTSCIPPWVELPIIPMLTEWRCVDGVTAGIKLTNIATTSQQARLTRSALSYHRYAQ